ncbi:protein ALP1-like [Rutidosis leptorrhynchoides]|uniref:protein ALP1-like n=1 Tax=Rutidosis leptorrhynchoides TaxID=125765 RepID=UPI003A98E96E
MSSTSSSSEEFLMQVLDIINSEALESENEAESSHKRRYIEREHEAAHVRLMTDYFVEGCKYSDDNFKRRFRMRRRVFLRIMEDILNYHKDPLPEYFKYFHLRVDARGKLSISTYLKITAALRQLAYGDTPDLFDEYLQMLERTSRESLMHFCKCIIDLYKDEYRLYIKRLYEAHEDIHGLPGMMRSIDCMHWAWGRCPVAWKCQFTRGDHKVPTIMLEAVASYDNWIWHAFFGVAGSNNDLNVLNASNLFNSMLNEETEDIPFTVNGVEYKRGYYLADGIYPGWASFVKAFSSANDEKRKYFSKKQAAARKDVERTFGILQGRWHILQQPARAYSVNVMKQMMYTCIILHNIIVEDNGFALTENDWVYEPVHNMQTTWIERCETYRRRTKELRDMEVHEGLRSDLVEHVWANRETSESETESD